MPCGTSWNEMVEQATGHFGPLAVLQPLGTTAEEITVVPLSSAVAAADGDDGHRRAPVDRRHKVYAGMVLAGIGFLLPYNRLAAKILVSSKK